MKIAIIGTGNVGGALATQWAKAGHQIFLGSRKPESFEDSHLLNNPHTSVHTIPDAVREADVILLATPAMAAIEVTKSLGDTSGKVLIDAMNVVRGNGPKGYSNTSEAILDHTQTRDVVKCFNTTGYNNMENPVYGQHRLDLFMAGDSEKGKNIAKTLAIDAGFAACYDIGGNTEFSRLEDFANFWIHIALFQGFGRDIGFKLLRR